MNLNRPIILASASPRRQYLLHAAGFEFVVKQSGIDETYPGDMPVEQVARFLANLKSEAIRPSITNEIVVAADTVVILDNKILNKPENREHAVEMLTMLAGRTHKVMTGVSIIDAAHENSFDDTTFVTFEKLTQAEIETYIDEHQPYDKAGSYGAQDCLPENYDPTSDEERKFMHLINKPDLAGLTKTSDQKNRHVIVIKRIEGSYFNVMGLPVHKVYERLAKWK